MLLKALFLIEDSYAFVLILVSGLGKCGGLGQI